MNILITGASRGMGLEFVRQYLERGERVFAGCRNPRRAMGLEKLKNLYPYDLTIVPLDVADTDSVRRSREFVEKETDQLNLLINNAGIYSTQANQTSDPGRSQTLGYLTQKEALSFFRVNAVGALLVTQEYLKLLCRGENPKVVNITSGYGSVASNTSGFPYLYSASKAALNMYTRTLAADLKGAGITVAVLDPGWVRTDMGGPKATLTPEKAVEGMIDVVDQLKLKETNRFLSWLGKKVQW